MIYALNVNHGTLKRQNVERKIRANTFVTKGSAVAAVASHLRMREHFVGDTIVIIICGANICLETLKNIS
jgi:threonine dehydratase